MVKLLIKGVDNKKYEIASILVMKKNRYKGNVI